MRALDEEPGAARFSAPHVRRRFGPVEVERIGAAVLVEFRDTGLRLLWDEAGPADALAVGAGIAALLRSEGGGCLAWPERVRPHVRRRLTDPPPARPDVVRRLSVAQEPEGVRLAVETTVPGWAPVAAVLGLEQAAALADLLAPGHRRARPARWPVTPPAPAG
ncbi:hypothetical protein I6A60_05935 [Frankia sp. AgB1.9]|uniref:hypothetical protein n=1 Tax=unclassified Frankia TaxID=2632575 RepID=UPI001932E5BC|nr:MULTISPECIES: hypothetical protein [unclassified Frankia]MBL7487458.1 hypothetical protein [Frankia sp. AgW1.1]MBL7547420.1 hypothetical protein [Frankia sp. AgB1.9]MBL7618805.1 hypothetical protein [Frankia sp. AgB1.8]